MQTDQKSVTFMFDQKHTGKIKNNKILHWWSELSYYSFDIVYKPGLDNIPHDVLSCTVFHVPYHMTNLFDSYTMRCAIPV